MFQANLMIVYTSSAYVCIMEWSWGAGIGFLSQKIDLEDVFQQLVGAWSAGPGLPAAGVGRSVPTVSYYRFPDVPHFLLIMKIQQSKC